MTAMAEETTGATGPRVTERPVEIATADGSCDAVFTAPTSGAHPGVLIWPDAFGLRPVFRDMGRRLAAKGYAVLVPNPFYRVARTPVALLDATTFDFQSAADRARLGALMASIGAPGAAEADAAAFVAFLDAQPEVDTRRLIGTQGYCMGGALVFRTAAARPDRIGAGASFHGGGLVTANAGSPHTLVSHVRARMYVAIASNDDERQPDAKDTLRDAFAAAHVPAEIEVYASLHGWCITDMPTEQGKPIYNRSDAERAWAKLLALYDTALR